MSSILEPFITAAPEFVLRMFAMDCAERLFWRERMRSCEPSELCWKTLKQMRQHQTQPEAGADLTSLRESTFEQYIDAEGTHTGGIRGCLRSQHRACHRAAWAIVMEDPTNAARIAAQALQNMGPDDELHWALGRLTWLKGTHQWAGDRLAFLLPEGEIETPEPLHIRRR